MLAAGQAHDHRRREAGRAGAGEPRVASSERDLAYGFGFLRGGARPPLPVIIDYIERYKNVFGVEPICTTLTSADVPIAPSTFYAARIRPLSARAVRDEELKPVIARVHKENYGVYGIRKMHAQLNREESWLGVRRLRAAPRRV